MRSTARLEVKDLDYTTMSQLERKQVREYCATLQGGRCIHCNMSLVDEPSTEVQSMSVDLSLFPREFLKYQQHLHHNHKTNKVVGTVHARCNAVLWQYYGE